MLSQSNKRRALAQVQQNGKDEKSETLKKSPNLQTISLDLVAHIMKFLPADAYHTFVATFSRAFALSRGPFLDLFLKEPWSDRVDELIEWGALRTLHESKRLDISDEKKREDFRKKLKKFSQRRSFSSESFVNRQEKLAILANTPIEEAKLAPVPVVHEEKQLQEEKKLTQAQWLTMVFEQIPKCKINHVNALKQNYLKAQKEFKDTPTSEAKQEYEKQAKRLYFIFQLHTSLMRGMLGHLSIYSLIKGSTGNIDTYAYERFKEMAYFWNHHESIINKILRNLSLLVEILNKDEIEDGEKIKFINLTRQFLLKQMSKNVITIDAKFVSDKPASYAELLDFNPKGRLLKFAAKRKPEEQFDAIKEKINKLIEKINKKRDIPFLSSRKNIWFRYEVEYLWFLAKEQFENVLVWMSGRYYFYFTKDLDRARRNPFSGGFDFNESFTTFQLGLSPGYHLDQLPVYFQPILKIIKLRDGFLCELNTTHVGKNVNLLWNVINECIKDTHGLCGEFDVRLFQQKIADLNRNRTASEKIKPFAVTAMASSVQAEDPMPDAAPQSQSQSQSQRGAELKSRIPVGLVPSQHILSGSGSSHARMTMSLAALPSRVQPSGVGSALHSHSHSQSQPHSHSLAHASLPAYASFSMASFGGMGSLGGGSGSGSGSAPAGQQREAFDRDRDGSMSLDR